jgi:hypothetical protein
MNYLKYARIALVVSFLLSVRFLPAQSYKIAGFSNYKFGTESEIIKEDFPAKWKGVRFIKFEKGTMLFSGGNYLGFPVSQWKFEFFENKLCQVELDFAPAKDQQNKKILVNALEASINLKYFPSKATMRDDGGSFFWIEANNKEEVAKIISLDYGFKSLDVSLDFTDYLTHAKAMHAQE